MHRAKLDKNDALQKFCENLEASIIETVESGKMTKDLAICVHNTNNVSREHYLNTFEFLDAIRDTLHKKLGK
jgi:isocitrate dehydrogenase